ncbi:MAG: hypothetical protein OIF32_11960, partial [Campylobacterales bacterium]|nr:hypothetical protein [Campylobacterales bacterium]
MIVDRLLYSLVITIKFFLKITPWIVNKYFLIGLSKFFYYVDKKHRDIVYANLEFAFGDEYSHEQRVEISKKCFQKFTFYMFDFIVSIDRSEEELRDMIEFEDEHILENAIKEGKKVIAVSAHFSNFELILKSMGAFF